MCRRVVCLKQVTVSDGQVLSAIVFIGLLACSALYNNLVWQEHTTTERTLSAMPLIQ